MRKMPANAKPHTASNTKPSAKSDAQVNAPIVALAAKTHRCIASRFPPVDLYEDLTTPEHFQQFHALESLTNPRLETTQGASPIDAAFAYTPTATQGGRFNRDYAAYYCALEEGTAVGEAVFHRARFLREAQMPATVVEARIVVADLKADALIDIRSAGSRFAALYDKDDYRASQEFGARLYAADSEGIIYNSVRCAGGHCIAAFTPAVLRRARQSKHLDLQWDGQTIVNVMQKSMYRL
jgi:RES domain-containing protein